VNTLWLKYDNWMKGQHPGFYWMIRGAAIREQARSHSLKIHSNVGAGLLAKASEQSMQSPDQRPFFQRYAPTRIPIVHSTAT
jgi:hypothetical protein